jgi:hypothetical protein
VSIIKSVPNLIFYLHESQFLAIYFELYSSGVIFNSENADEWVPPVIRRALHRARLTVPPDSRSPASPLAPSSRPPLSEAAVARSEPSPPCPKPPTPTSTLAAIYVESCRAAVHVLRRPRLSWAAPRVAVGRARTVHTSRASAVNTGCAPRGRGSCACVAVGRTRTVHVAHALLCNWAERKFDPVALKLIFSYFLNIFKFLQI